MEKMPNLLTSKPIVYLVNMSATDYTRKKNKWLPKIHAWIQEHGGGVMIPFSVEFEAKLWEMRENLSAKQVRTLRPEAVVPCLPLAPSPVCLNYACRSVLRTYLGQTENSCRHAMCMRAQRMSSTPALAIHCGNFSCSCCCCRRRCCCCYTNTLVSPQAFLEESKCVSALPKMIVTGYKELNLIYYFTAGETEVGSSSRGSRSSRGGQQ
jgi:hypothetical protein